MVKVPELGGVPEELEVVGRELTTTQVARAHRGLEEVVVLAAVRVAMVGRAV